MAVEFRQACELGFRSGAISVLVATSTVATGINLPAQRVIVRDLFLGQRDNILDSSKMRQMAGRAGRSGIDSKGEAIFIVGRREPPSRLQQIMSLLAAPVRALLSPSMAHPSATGSLPSASHLLSPRLAVAAVAEPQLLTYLACHAVHIT